jgi:uncharacterized protein YjbJ (UPF0337 family)
MRVPIFEQHRSFNMNKDQVKGRAKEAKGKVKEVVGEITDDKSLEYKGKVEQVTGKVQAGYGDVTRKFGKDE